MTAVIFDFTLDAAIR